MTTTTATEDDARAILERARAAMHGLAETETAIAAVAVRLQRARDAIRPEEDVLDAVLRAVVADGVVLDDVADQVLKIRRANESALAELGILGPVERRLQERLVAVHRERADDALRALATELDVVLTAVRPLIGQLDGVNDAEAAITTDRVGPWRQAVELAERHGALRGAQRVITAGALDAPDQARRTARVSSEVRDMVNNYGFIRDPARHYPELDGSDVNRSELRTGEVRIFSGRVITDAHTDAPVRPRPWLSGDSLDDLRFACRPGVASWVPSIKALTDARDEHQRNQQAAARAAAERRPGHDDPRPPLRAGRRMPPPPTALLDRLAREELGGAG